ncbi:MAG TPA: hypothetical protein VI998_04215 [Patescibacteria group bacterium]|nr:hypothetical protein [Patescibacteria group bacterium]
MAEENKKTEESKKVEIKIGALLKNIALGFGGGAGVSFMLALIMRFAFGYDFYVMFGVFALILTSLAFGLFPPDVPRFAKFILYTTVAVIYGLVIIAVWPSVEYGLMTAGPRSTEAYKELKRYEDLKLGETLRPKTLGGREVVRNYREHREIILNDWYHSEQRAIVSMLSQNLINPEEADRRMEMLTAQYNRDLEGIAAIKVSEPSGYKQSSDDSDPAPLGDKLKKSIPNLPVVLKIIFIAAAAFLILGLIWTKYLKNGWLKTAALLAVGGTAIYFIIAILQANGVSI